MDKRGSISGIDPLLRPFLQSSDDAECERLLAGLLSNHASALIKEAIWFKLRALSTSTADGVQHQEAEDIYSEAMLHLVTRLRDLQTNPDGKPINNFRSYVSTWKMMAISPRVTLLRGLKTSRGNMVLKTFSSSSRLTLSKARSATTSR